MPCGKYEIISFLVLPVELLLEALVFLSPKDLSQVSLINSTYHRLANSEQLWQRLCMQWGIDGELNESHKNRPALFPPFHRCFWKLEAHLSKRRARSTRAMETIPTDRGDHSTR